jgi:UDP-N-acetylmuramyl pentapeptide synthase
VREVIKPGDCVLVKGSRAMGLEVIGEAIAVVPVSR